MSSYGLRNTSGQRLHRTATTLSYRGHMGVTSEEPTDWTALLEWYVSSSELIEELEACWVIVDAMLCGSAASNLVAAEAQNGLTAKAELWLAAHPCPEIWNGEHMDSIVHTSMDIGALIVASDGDPLDANHADLADKVKEARLMLDEVRVMVSQLTSGLG